MRFETFRKKDTHARSVTLRSSNKAMITPTYFPAVSTLGTDISIKLVKYLIQTEFPCMLISAYDYYHLYETDSSLTRKINNYSTNGKFLLVDSGGYEQKWNDDKEWNFKIYQSTLNKINTDFYTSLDIEVLGQKKSYIFKSIIDSYGVLSGDVQFLPIFDGNTPKDLVKNIETFLDEHPDFIQFITIREKNCGVTLSERANTVYKIRQLIDDNGEEQVIHILGCGNPLSISLYAFCGADSFDSRDWYLKTLDTELMLLRDFSHLELMNCKCKTCKIERENLYTKTILHNITGYLELMKTLQKCIKNNTLNDFLLKYVTKDLLTKIQKS